MTRTALTAAALLLTIPALADPAVVEEARATPSDAGWTVSVTLSHGDTGWDDYADGWRVETPEGAVLGTRELLHPHVTEQPFTRSLSGVEIPAGMDIVMIRARTNVDGWGEAVFPMALN